MRTSARTLHSAVVLGTVLVLSAGPASAQEACEAYSQGCEDAGVLDTTVVQAPSGSTTAETATTAETRSSSVSSTPTTLPFTGGETVLAALAGAGAVAAGAALVVAGRRRASAGA